MIVQFGIQRVIFLNEFMHMPVHNALFFLTAWEIAAGEYSHAVNSSAAAALACWELRGNATSDEVWIIYQIELTKITDTVYWDKTIPE